MEVAGFLFHSLISAFISLSKIIFMTVSTNLATWNDDHIFFWIDGGNQCLVPAAKPPKGLHSQLLLMIEQSQIQEGYHVQLHLIIMEGVLHKCASVRHIKQKGSQPATLCLRKK